MPTALRKVMGGYVMGGYVMGGLKKIPTWHELIVDTEQQIGE